MALLLEGVAMNVPAVDPESYGEFRHNVGRLAVRVPGRRVDEDKLLLTRSILEEFEKYHTASEQALRDNLAAWQGAASMLLDELLQALCSSGSQTGAALGKKLRALTCAAEVTEWKQELEAFLQPISANNPDSPAANLKQPNQSTANDNAAGLPGGGKALEHVKRIMDEGTDGYVVVFQLRCMEVISQRFGIEAVQDCLMAVSAFLTAGLDSRDVIYHWSDASLLAVLQSRPSEAILTADIQRVLSQNRESSIKVAGRPIMLRIPLAFDIIPISRLRNPDDLLRLAGRNSKK